MSRTVPLREIAHARAGDKGNRSNVSVFAYEPRHYPAIRDQLTTKRIKAAFPDLFLGPIERFEIDHLFGLNFVMDEAL
ncbi:MAG: AtuA-related protein, partial [Geminicoccaceae bacterium]